YSIELLANDVLNLLDALRFDRVHFCGLSMGGQIGMWLGHHAPSRLHKLVLCNTGATIGTHEAWNARIDAVLSQGLADVSSAVVSRWFTPEFALLHPDVVASAKSIIESANPAGYASCCAAVRDCDAREMLSSVSVPTLVIAGSHDFATPAADGRFLAENIPGAQYVELRAAHLSNIEAAAQFISVVENFLFA
ncbi:MAG TPA: alpha/beta fold hydrolase, partial [Candidatus Dormibacteraeota bacterium]|nr:alpha/beta fold hydrolase [Candidatus Dormibacteraeota bacterium]